MKGEKYALKAQLGMEVEICFSWTQKNQVIRTLNLNISVHWVNSFLKEVNKTIST